MTSLSDLTAQPRPLRVNDDVYLLHPLTIAEIGQLQSWVDSQFPDPFELVNQAIARGSYTVAQQQFLLTQALERASRPRNLIGTPAADQLLQSAEGVKQLLVLSVRKGRPEFSQEDASRLFEQLSFGQVMAAFAATGVDSLMADPKDPPKTNGASGSLTSRSRRRQKRLSTGGSSSTRG